MRITIHPCRCSLDRRSDAPILKDGRFLRGILYAAKRDKGRKHRHCSEDTLLTHKILKLVGTLFSVSKTLQRQSYMTADEPHHARDQNNDPFLCLHAGRITHAFFPIKPGPVRSVEKPSCLYRGRRSHEEKSQSNPQRQLSRRTISPQSCAI